MPDRASIPHISAPLLVWFRWIVRGYFRRSFHGVRIRGADNLRGIQGPLIVYANHASWWDPLVSVLLAHRLLGDRRHYAPMDAAALERYSVLKQFGVFGVEMHTARGAVQFLRTGTAVLAAGGALWITPQGQFVDARDRPLRFKPGLAALAARVANAQGRCILVPLAIEYTFWNERTPECLLEVGRAVLVEVGSTAASLEGQLEHALVNTMDCLRTCGMQRDPRLFSTLSVGRAGAGGMYALLQRAKAFALRRKYRPEHTAIEEGQG